MLHLDTDIAIAHLRGDPIVTQRLAQALPAVGISSLVVAELRYGVYASSDPILAKSKLDEFLSSLSVIPFDAPAADVFGSIRFSLRKKGRPIGDLDMLIAAAAMSHGATLVTRNTRHFSEVEGLQIEDWVD